MANDENLRPVQTEEEAREQGRRGGVASGKARLRKKHGRELMRAILELKEIDPRIVDELQKAWGINPLDVTKEVAMNVRQVDKAIKRADTNAFKAVHQVAGTLEAEGAAGATVNINITEKSAKAAEKWSKGE